MGKVTRRTVALIVTLLGLLAVSVGIGLIYLPAGIIAGGAAGAAVGTFLIDVESGGDA